jgi:hypothetical protein
VDEVAASQPQSGDVCVQSLKAGPGKVSEVVGEPKAPVLDTSSLTDQSANNLTDGSHRNGEALLSTLQKAPTDQSASNLTDGSHRNAEAPLSALQKAPRAEPAVEQQACAELVEAPTKSCFRSASPEACGSLVRRNSAAEALRAAVHGAAAQALGKHGQEVCPSEENDFDNESVNDIFIAEGLLNRVTQGPERSGLQANPGNAENDEKPEQDHEVSSLIANTRTTSVNSFGAKGSQLGRRAFEEPTEVSQQLSLIQQVFAHYAWNGISTGCTILTMTNFRRFLYDCRLLSGSSEETEGTLRSCGSAHHEGPEHLISQVQADLVFARATCSVGDGQQGRGNMTLDAFISALSDIGVQCFLRHTAAPDTALEAVYLRLLIPLGERLLGAEGQEVLSAVALTAEPDISGLLQRARRCLATVFCTYAEGGGGVEPYEKGFWTSTGMRKWAIDRGLMAELSLPALFKLFNDCVKYEVRGGRGQDTKMSFNGFQLALVMISQRIHGAFAPSPLERIAFLLLRMSVSLGANELAPIARSSLEAARGVESNN